jgi:hypothetical protein
MGELQIATGHRAALRKPASERRRRRPKPASGTRLRIRYDASGLTYPQIGQYTSPEPLHAWTARRLYGPQAYSYATARPLKLVDQDGRVPTERYACSTIGPVTICTPTGNGISIGLVAPVGPAGVAARAAAGAPAGAGGGAGAGAFWGGVAAAGAAALLPGGTYQDEMCMVESSSTERCEYWSGNWPICTFRCLDGSLIECDVRPDLRCEGLRPRRDDPRCESAG